MDTQVKPFPRYMIYKARYRWRCCNNGSFKTKARAGFKREWWGKTYKYRMKANETTTA